MDIKIKSFVFFDTETTGLPEYENNETKITELCLISAQAEHISLGVIPRVQNKLTLCFNPNKEIQEGAKSITGLHEGILKNETPFNTVSLNIIKNFLERLNKPICLVAHNGNKFDYPILRAHIESTKQEFPDDILCMDSLLAFEKIENKPEQGFISFRLGEVYKRLTKKSPTNAHQAEEDVKMLLECAVKLGDRFIEYANKNATRFNNIPAMEPKNKPQ